MFDKVRELSSKGKTNTQIAFDLGIDRHRVGRYLRMSRNEFVTSKAYKRNYVRLLDKYEQKIYQYIYLHPFVSSAEVGDYIRKYFPEVGRVSRKTVYNYTKYIRAKYSIAQVGYEQHRIMTQLEATPYGYQAQVDFGERRVPVAGSNGHKRIYFMAMVLSRSRYKFVFMSDTPFTTEKSIYAHELAFEFFGGVPETILYDQDKCFLYKEYYGDNQLTYKFKRFVDDIGFRPEFCHKNDPESKGKVENVVKYVKGNFMRTQEFTTIAQYNKEAIDWLNRTGNQLEHSVTKLIPAQEFLEEIKSLRPYYGKPTAPNIEPVPYNVSKTNVIHYKGNTYSLPYGTYKHPRQKCYVLVQHNELIVYATQTGKELTRHTISSKRGQYINKEAHKRPLDKTVAQLEEQIMTYVQSDDFMYKLLANLKIELGNYYKSHLKHLIAHLKDYSKEDLLQGVKWCVLHDVASAYRLQEVVCTMSKKSPQELDSSQIKLLGQADHQAMATPEKSTISTYNEILQICPTQNN